MKPHKHCELIKAWADGAEIQMYSKTFRDWIDHQEPHWNPDYEYRIKPEQKPDVVKLFKAEAHPILGIRFTECTDLPRNDGEHWIKTVWDAEKPELKSAEVLK